MSTIVIAPFNVANFPEGGGHFWVYMQYVQGFRQQGCDVYWLEQFVSSGDKTRDEYMLAQFAERMEHFGLKGKSILYTMAERSTGSNAAPVFIGTEQSAAMAVLRKADLLVNFHYAMDPAMLAEFRQTVLIDIDPGLLQLWIDEGQLHVSRHDYYCTIGEHIAAPPANGLPWISIRPPVSLEHWPYRHQTNAQDFTTISSWWGGGGRGEFVAESNGQFYENNKRITFLEYIDLPQRTSQTFELALNLGPGDTEDRDNLLAHNWKITDPYNVADSPAAYQSYIQNSRGEFGCAKPSYLKFQNAWVSDRTVCYLASGKPVVVQDTGPSSYLPDGAGMFRFSTMEDAVDAFDTINADYAKHCKAAREIAEAYFDSSKVAATILSGCQL